MGGNKFSVTGSGRKAEGVEKEKKKGEKVGENNDQLCFVWNHGWHTQARLDQKAVENNGQLRFVRHHGWRTQAA